MIFARDLQQARKRSGIALDPMPYPLGDMLVDEEDGNIFALASEPVKGSFDGAVVGLGVHDEEVLLRIGGGGYVLDRRVGGQPGRRREGGRCTPTPASSMPVTVSCGLLATRVLCYGAWHGVLDLVANDGQELSILVLGCWCCHDGSVAWMGQLLLGVPAAGAVLSCPPRPAIVMAQVR